MILREIGKLLPTLQGLWNGVQNIGKFFTNLSTTLDNISSGNVHGISDLGIQDPLEPFEKYADSYVNTITGAGPNGLQEWQAEREDTAYQRSTADMKAAGLNPALMYGSSAGGPAASSAGSSGATGISDLLQLAMLPLQMKMADADITLKQSEASKNNADAANVRQSTDFAAELQPLLVEAKRVSNDLGRQQRVYMEKQTDLVVENIAKTAAETASETEKAALYAAETALRNAEMNQLIELMPYREALMQSQAAEARAHASLMAVQEMYQRKIVDSDYLDNMFEEMRSLAGSAAAKAAVDDLKARIRTGKLISVSDDASLLAKIGAGVVNYPVAVVANILDNAAPIIAAGLGAGAAVKVAGLKNAGQSSTGSSILVAAGTSEFGNSYRTLGGSR